MQLLTVQLENLRNSFAAAIDESIPHDFRTISEFAEQDIICPPSSPRADEPFLIEAQPFAGLLFAAIESGDYYRFAVTGPLQSGKTFLFIIVALYHLFEVGEDVIYGIPQMEMAMDKWKRDFLPVIMASKYRDMMPESGAGSQGGKFESITFKNGKTLKFMSAKGGDEKRSGVTSRILIMTEIDKYDEAAEASRESDPVTQMIGRLESVGISDSRVYMECSVSFATGRIWVEYNAGTGSRIATPCPYCKAYVSMERENLHGWHDAEDEIEAHKKAHFKCPECDEKWSEEDRIAANKACVLVHRGQEITPDGEIVGSAPKTYTIGFRWNSSNNLLKSAADLGWKEWKARIDPDDENSERTLLQFTWAKPWSGESNATGIKPSIVSERLTYVDQYLVPEDTEVLTLQIDLHFRWNYWTVMASGRNPNPAWKEGAKLANGLPMPRFLAPHYSIVDYGVAWNPDRQRLGPEGAMEAGLELLAEELESRLWSTPEGRIVGMDLALIDAGFHQEIGLRFVTGIPGGIWQLARGKGRKDVQGTEKYIAPKAATEDLYPGDHWYYSRHPACKESNGKKWWMVFTDTSHWMHSVHAGFMALPFIRAKDETGHGPRRPGSIAIFGKDEDAHLRNLDVMIPRSSYAMQICGWVWSETKSKKEGSKVGWNAPYQEDHWLDTTYGCRAADSIVRTNAKRFRNIAAVPKSREATQFTTPDGRPYLLTDRK